MSDLHVLWFRRDLRLHDHPALMAACAAGGPVLPLYIFEPGLMQDISGRQFDFLTESLADLDSALRQRGSQLCLETGEAVDVLSRIHLQHGIAAIHFHADIAGKAGLDRDRAVRSWATKAGIPLREQAPPGLPGARISRAGWETAWQAGVRQRRLQAPAALPPHPVSGSGWPLAEDFAIAPDPCPGRQTGGRTAAILALRSFLSGGGRDYGKPDLSSLRRSRSSSHLSPHLSHGTVSLREVWQGAAQTRAALLEDGDGVFAASLDSFMERLRQRSLAVQETLERTGPDGDRRFLPPDPHHRPAAGQAVARLDMWINGQTGFPLIDAGMRCLRETGALEAALRDLLLSFAVSHLWLSPAEASRRLSALCTDFDPAVFFANARTVAGIAATHRGHLPNPVRQSLARDPDGDFIRAWVPELAGLPARHIHAPWDAPKGDLAGAGIVLGRTYPMRMVDHVAAAREARSHLAPPAAAAGSLFQAPAAPRTPAFPAGLRRSGRPGRPKSRPVQLSLDLPAPR